MHVASAPPLVITGTCCNVGDVFTVAILVINKFSILILINRSIPAQTYQHHLQGLGGLAAVVVQGSGGLAAVEGTPVVEEEVGRSGHLRLVRNTMWRNHSFLSINSALYGWKCSLLIGIN